MRNEDLFERLVRWCEEFLHGLAILGAAHSVHDDGDWHVYNRTVLGARIGNRRVLPRSLGSSPLDG